MAKSLKIHAIGGNDGWNRNHWKRLRKLEAPFSPLVTTAPVATIFVISGAIVGIGATVNNDAIFVNCAIFSKKAIVVNGAIGT